MAGADASYGASAAAVPGGLAAPTAQGGSRIRHYRLNALNLNQAATDLGSFTGLPSAYLVRRLTGLNATGSLALSTLDLRTAAAGAGSAIIAAAALAGFVDGTIAADVALTISNVKQTASALVARAVVSAGAAATIDLLLEVEDLS